MFHGGEVNGYFFHWRKLHRLRLFPIPTVWWFLMVKETDTSYYERSQGDTCTPKGVIRRFH